jgi:DNA-binding NarL/FixJ family response regulator
MNRPKPSGSAKSGSQANRVRVLIADDHRAALERVREFLCPFFDVVGTAENGALLVEAAEILRPEVIVLDVSMPVMDGLSALRELRRRECTAKVIFLSINGDSMIADECLSSGAAAYIQKFRMTSDLIPAIYGALTDPI